MSPTLVQYLVTFIAAFVYGIAHAGVLPEPWGTLLAEACTAAAGSQLFRRAGDQPIGKLPPPPSLPLVMLLLALGCSSCAGVKSPITWPQAVSCAPTVSDVIGNVTQVLYTDKGSPAISDDGVKRLETLAEKYGADTVVCLVDKLLNDWRRPGAAMHPERLAAEARADSFLSRAGVHTISRTE